MVSKCQNFYTLGHFLVPAANLCQCPHKLSVFEALYCCLLIYSDLRFWAGDSCGNSLTSKDLKKEIIYLLLVLLSVSFFVCVCVCRHMYIAKKGTLILFGK